MKFTAGYSIKDLEKLSGIKAHTLRIWEKRYSLFEPDRTKTNIRYYSNDDLKRILNISILNKNGIKISKIALMRDEEITEKVAELNLILTDNEDVIDNLMVGMIDLDESHFENIFTACISRIGFENTIQKVISPFFTRIGTMWQTGGINPAQEHFVSNIVRQKMIVAIDGLKNSKTKKKGSAVLFLPENELHELSLLFYNYALKSRNYKTIYLGQSVPSADIIKVSEIVKPDLILSIITTPYQKKEFDKLIKLIQTLSDKRQILLSGKVVYDNKKKFPASVKMFNGLDELLKLI